ncbi:GMP/IMP nucleotidase [Thalassotalea aquiviva]|uniref:GMP/IMP nucleotidase n=1 Tax=Thalassotalea aquiviva TaxID=3242415 RepID=UPI00352B1251
MFDWAKIHTVLLDMDGTILDLHFDNHFWLHHLPLSYAKQKGVSETSAKQYLTSCYQDVEGTISWYCLDYWAEKTQLPINQLKREIQHLIQLRDDAHDFLTALRDSGRQVILVTNAHPDSLALKIERTQLDKYFDQLISCHQFGTTKESQLLWQRLQAHVGFDNATTLFVDDSLAVLNSAKKYGIEHILAVANPDSKREHNAISGFPTITDYRTLIDDILASPIN